MFKRIIFIITPVISIMNRNSSRDIQTSLSMMTSDIQSLSITHHFICIVVTDSVVKAKNHCRRRHHHHHHHHHHWQKICVQMLLIMAIFQTLTRFHQMVWKYGFLIRLRCVMKGRNEKIPLRYNSHWNHRLRCHRKTNRKIPLYHIFIEFANSVDKAQSPLYFAELYWAELIQLHDMVQSCAIQNMTNTNIIRFVMSAMINMRWIAKYWQKCLGSGALGHAPYWIVSHI